jgi:hypothetical protein
LAAAIEVTFIRLAGDCDVGVFVILVCWGRVGWGRVGWFVSRCGVSGWFVLRLVAGWSSGSNGQDSGDNELEQQDLKFNLNSKLIDIA